MTLHFWEKPDIKALDKLRFTSGSSINRVKSFKLLVEVGFTRFFSLYGKNAIYGKLRRDIGKYLRRLCDYKGVK